LKEAGAKLFADGEEFWEPKRDKTMAGGAEK